MCWCWSTSTYICTYVLRFKMIKLISRIRLTSGADLIGANLEDLILNLGTIYEEDIFILYK